MIQALQRPLTAKSARPSPRTLPSASLSSESSLKSASSLDQEIATALAIARMISTRQGLTSPESAVAWDIVEELITAKSRQQIQHGSTPPEQCRSESSNTHQSPACNQ
ncbi:MAG: CP12 domain-containing protein [Elainellaceae cyanobacterium]